MPPDPASVPAPSEIFPILAGPTLNCLFIDFEKAFDSLHREILWKIWSVSNEKQMKDRTEIFKGHLPHHLKI